MKPIYTLNNIHDLLLKKYPNFEWSYEIYDRRTGDKKIAEIEDFSNNLFETLALVFMHNDDEYSLDVAVSNFNFMVYEDEPNIMDSGSVTRLRDNFTSEWVDLLLSEHGLTYANELISYCEKCKKQINDRAMDEIAKQVKIINARAELDALPYERLMQRARKVLPTENSEEEKNS